MTVQPVRRMDKNKLPKIDLKNNPLGSSPPGRLPKRWRDSWHSVSQEKMQRQLQDLFSTTYRFLSSTFQSVCLNILAILLQKSNRTDFLLYILYSVVILRLVYMSLAEFWWKVSLILLLTMSTLSQAFSLILTISLSLFSLSISWATWRSSLAFSSVDCRRFRSQDSFLRPIHFAPWSCHSE